MKITLTIIAAFFVLTVAAQEHRNAIGLRGGFSSGVTYRIFVNDFNAFEGWLGFRDNGMQAQLFFSISSRFSWSNQIIFSFIGELEAMWGIKSGKEDITTTHIILKNTIIEKWLHRFWAQM